MDMRTCGITTITIDWHPVATGFPDDDTTVLVALDDKEVYSAYRDAGSWRELDGSPIPDECVTHWAHMPAHPGDKSEGAPVALLPLNEDTLMILGRPDFACYFTAQRMRDLGHKIKRSSTAEQAAVIHLLVNMYQQHGAAWFEHVSAYLDRGHQQTAAATEQAAA